MDVALIVLTGASSGDRFNFNLTEDGAIIGRLPECDLVLQDTLVSRKHAKIFVKKTEVMLADLGSSHGTIHMGFRVEGGDEKARKLSPGDEFKVGGTVFRAEFEEIIPEPETDDLSDKVTRKKLNSRQKLLYGVGGVALIAVLVLLLQDSDTGIPRQRSNDKISLPDKSAYGFLPEGDKAHADKVQFIVPTSDNIVEYDFVSNGTTTLSLDGAKVETLPRTDGSWDQRMLLVRDPIGGRERDLVFDEESIRTDVNGELVGPLKRWGVRNVRYASLPPDDQANTTELLAGAVGLIETMGRANDSLFRLSRALSKAGLALLREASLESQDVPIEAETPRPDPELMKISLNMVINERQNGLGSTSVAKHLKVVTQLIGSCEAELWRRFGVEARQALQKAKAKEHIEAHDQLLGIQTMIGDSDDIRYRKAGEWLDDKKIIPPRVRKDPGKYRKNLYD